MTLFSIFVLIQRHFIEYAIRSKILCADQIVFLSHRMPTDPYEPLTLDILMDYFIHIDTIGMKQSIL